MAWHEGDRLLREECVAKVTEVTNLVVNEMRKLDRALQESERATNAKRKEGAQCMSNCIAEWHQIILHIYALLNLREAIRQVGKDTSNGTPRLRLAVGRMANGFKQLASNNWFMGTCSVEKM